MADLLLRAIDSALAGHHCYNLRLTEEDARRIKADLQLASDVRVLLAWARDSRGSFETDGEEVAILGSIEDAMVETFNGSSGDESLHLAAESIRAMREGKG